MLGDLRGGTPQHLCGGGEPSGAQNEVFIQAFRVSQCGSNGGELVQRCLAVFDDLGGDNPGLAGFGVLQRLVTKPEEFERRLVAWEQFLALESGPCWLVRLVRWGAMSTASPVPFQW